ncbi:MAG: DUF1566 domain-containing protein [Haliea sp.]|nr:DUF1566 domain-containing protein [Haliea sp.]
MLRQPASGLEWTQSDSSSTLDWNAAKGYCDGKAGGWRLPSSAELQSLNDDSSAVSLSCGPVTCKISPLFHLTWASFWSNETNGSSEAWTVFLPGLRLSSDVSSARHHRALCVRRF